MRTSIDDSCLTAETWPCARMVPVQTSAVNRIVMRILVFNIQYEFCYYKENYYFASISTFGG